MKRSVCILQALGGCLLGYSSFGLGYEPLAAGRIPTPRVVISSNSLLVTLTLTNATVADFRGLFFSDQVPTNLTVTPAQVLLNGNRLTNVILEVGNEGDLFPGLMPYRWVLETPTNLPQGNAVTTGAFLQISFSISSTTSGSVNLGDYFWAAAAPVSSNGVFGDTRVYEHRTVKFIRSMDEPILAQRLESEIASLTIDGVPGSIYELQSSTNLSDWSPLVTNLSPFTYVASNAASFPQRYFRVSDYLSQFANLVFESPAENQYLVRVYGVEGCAYVLESCSDLSNWLPLVTNLSPFSLTQTNAGSTHFYRARLLDLP